MISYIKRNKFLFLLSILLLFTIFFCYLFFICKFKNEKYYWNIKNENDIISTLKSHKYDFWRYFYNSGEAVSIQNNISRLNSSNKYPVFLEYIKKFFLKSSLNEVNNLIPKNDLLINNFYYFNLYLQLSVFAFTSFWILNFFNFVLIVYLIFKYWIIARIFNFYKLLLVLFFNFLGFLLTWNWEKDLFQEKNKLLEKKSNFLKNSRLTKIFWLIKNRYKSFNKTDNKNLIIVKNLSFKTNIKHSVFKHFLDLYKWIKFKKDISEKEHLYEQKNLFRNIKSKYILKNINLEIKTNSFNVIIGPNGAGKTTFIKSLINLNENFLGNIFWNNIDISKIDRKEFAQNVSYIPQFMNINYEINVFDFLLLTRIPYKEIYSYDKKKDEEIVLKAIKESGCFEFADKKMNELSGGQQQKVLLASILTQQAKTIILDEPTVFLDVKNQNFLLNSLKKFHEMGKTIIMILHDLQQAINYAENLIVMKNGSIYSSGNPKEIINKNLLEDVFEISCNIEKTNEKFEITKVLTLDK